MKLEDAVKEVRKIIREDEYKGNLSDRVIKSMAEIYVESCDDEGNPKPRTFWRAANGKASNLTRTQWLLTRTEAFKKWFGKSKIVDANGDPRVMYHGTWRTFDEFKVNLIKKGKVNMTLWSGPGFYFTDKEKIARIYAGGPEDNVYEVFLKLENPLVVDETGNAEKWSDRITRREAEKILLDGDNSQWLDHTICSVLARMDGDDGKGKARYKEMTRAQRVAVYVSRLKTDVVKLKEAIEAYGAKSQQKLLESICRHTGYDGVIHKIAPEVTEYVVYDPKAIKSAIENNGEFDAKNAVTLDESDGSAEKTRQNLRDIQKGTDEMAIDNLIDAFSALKSRAVTRKSGMDAALESMKKFAQDIVDRQGRHHEMKGIPPGGQYMEEGQFLRGSAAIEHAINHAGSGKRAEHLRRNLAPAYARIVANDSTTRATIQKMRQDLAGMSKHTLMRKMAEHLNDMLKHTDAYEHVKNMGKQEFSEWLEQNPEYNTGIVRKLMGDAQYRRERMMKGANGQMVGQGHEAWEEAKWAVGTRAVTSAIMFRECMAAKNHEPEQIMEHEIERAMENRPAQENIERREDPRIGRTVPWGNGEREITMIREDGENGELAYVRGDNGGDWVPVGNMNPSHVVIPNFVNEEVARGGLANREEPQVENGGAAGGGNGISEADMRDISETLGQSNLHRDTVEKFMNALRGNNEFGDDDGGLKDALAYIANRKGDDSPLLNSIVDKLGYEGTYIYDRNGAPERTGFRKKQNAVTGGGAAPAGGNGGVTALSPGDAEHLLNALSDIHGGNANIGEFKRRAESMFGREVNLEGANQREMNELKGHLQAMSEENPDSPSQAEHSRAAMEIINRHLGNVRPLDFAQRMREMNSARAAVGAASTYTDREGNVQTIQHNEGGLKATIHQTELGAVQAEMRKAFADAGDGVDGAEEYAHALSHFLGRGNDERSPHPGMRAEGVMKHQLAEKMERRLKAKHEAVENAVREFGAGSEEKREAIIDLQATVKAVNKIAGICGMTNDDTGMIPAQYPNLQNTLMPHEDHPGNETVGPHNSDRLYALGSAAPAAATGAGNTAGTQNNGNGAVRGSAGTQQFTDAHRQTFNELFNDAFRRAGQADPQSDESRTARAEGMAWSSVLGNNNGIAGGHNMGEIEDRIHSMMDDAVRRGDRPSYEGYKHVLERLGQEGGYTHREHDASAVQPEGGIDTSHLPTNHGDNTITNEEREYLRRMRQRCNINSFVTGGGSSSDNLDAAVAHAMAHFMARNGGINDENTTIRDLQNRMNARLAAKADDPTALQGTQMAIQGIANALGRQAFYNADGTVRLTAQVGNGDRPNDVGHEDTEVPINSRVERYLQNQHADPEGIRTWSTTFANLEHRNSEHLNDMMSELENGGWRGMFPDDGIRNEMISAIRNELGRRTGGSTASEAPAPAPAAANGTAQANNAPARPTDAQIDDLTEQVARHLGVAGHENEVREQINNMLNGHDDGRADQYMEQLGQAGLSNHPVVQAIRQRMAQNAPAATPAPSTAAPTANAPATGAAPAGQNATETVRPFSHTGSLDANHALRNAQITAGMARNRTQGMPTHFTSPNQVTPQNLADIFARLPKRGIFDHRNGDVRIPGVGRVDGFTALRAMVTDPSGNIGREMSSRLARQNTNNPWVRRLNEAMDVLHGRPSPTGTNAGGGATNFRAVQTHRMSNGVPVYSVPDHIQQQDRKIAQDKGFGNRNSPDHFHGGGNGCNCYRNDAALFLQSRGFDVSPKGAPDNNQQEFGNLKLAMHKAYEKANGVDRNATIANLERMRTTYPDGTWVSSWGGGHNTSLRLQGGQWYQYDGFYGNTRGRPLSSSDAAAYIYQPPMRMSTSHDENILVLAGFKGGGYARGINSMDEARRMASRYGVSDADFNRFKAGKATPDEINRWRRENGIISEFLQGAKNYRALMVETKMALHRKGNLHPTDQDVLNEMNREPIYWKANSSYVIKPTDPVIPEMFDQVR